MEHEQKTHRREILWETIGEYFNHSYDFSFLYLAYSLAEGICNRVDDITDIEEDVDRDLIWDCLEHEFEDSLIISYDEWHIMAHYQMPHEANLYEAMEQFRCDLAKVIQDYYNKGAI